MTDPYQILGIDRNASDEEIKKAYRRLSRKYHPDANINNPHKDEAEAKFKEVQQAYQQIMDERERGYSSGQYDGFYGNRSGGYGYYDPFGSQRGGKSQGTSGQDDMHLQAAANYIRSGHFKEALHVLDSIRERSALWYFYSASANSGLGNNVTALEQAKEAVRLDPQNMQYQMLLQRLQNGEMWYGQRQNPFGYGVSFDSSCCVKLCVANLLCNLCCGGGGLCCGGYGGPGGYYM